MLLRIWAEALIVFGLFIKLHLNRTAHTHNAAHTTHLISSQLNSTHLNSTQLKARQHSMMRNYIHTIQHKHLVAFIWWNCCHFTFCYIHASIGGDENPPPPPPTTTTTTIMVIRSNNINSGKNTHTIRMVSLRHKLFFVICLHSDNLLDWGWVIYSFKSTILNDWCVLTKILTKWFSVWIFSCLWCAMTSRV